MGVRRESVVLDLDDHLSPGLLRAAAAAGVLDESLGRIDDRSVGTSRNLNRVESDASNLGRTLDREGPSIDRYSGRLGLLVDAGLALGPALVTSAAVAVPAVTALAGEIGFLGLGLGTTELAFKGVGEALKAFNKAELAPTAANIAAAHVAMDKLPPSAQNLVLQLHRLGPELDRLREAAAGGIAPGLSSGLRSVVTDAPIVRSALHGIGLEVGDLARDAGRSLSSDQWRPFLRFLGHEAPLSIDATTRAAGHVTHGLAEMWMAFEPVNRDIDQGILRLARDFDQWATGLGRTKTFQDFLDYVEQNGPRVLNLLGEIAVTGVDIGRAIAPLGGPTISILAHLLEMLDAIAKSDLGTPLFAGLIAFRLYARGMQALGVQVDTSWKGIAAAPGQVSKQTSQLAASVRTSTGSIISDLRAMAAEYARDERTIVAGNRSMFFSGVGSERFFNPANTARTLETQTKAVGGLKSTVLSYMSQTSSAAVRTRARLGEVVKTGGQAAGVALVASGVADKVGLANTATFGLIGTLAGPYGAAVGGAVGLTMDLAHADDSLVDAQRRVKSAFDASSASIDLGQQAADWGQLNSQLDSTFAKIDQFKSFDAIMHPVDSLKTEMLAVNNLFTHNIQDSVDVANQAGDAMGKNLTIFTELHDKFTGSSSPVALTTAQLQQTASRAQPAMLALGITVQDLQDAYDANDGSLARLTGRIVNWINQADSAAGHTQAVEAAFAAMGDKTLTVEQRVQGLTTALDGLLDPMLGLSQSHDAFVQGLNDISQSVAHNSKTLLGNSDAAITNRTAIRTQVTNLKQWIEAQASANIPAHQMIANLKAGRQAIIEQGQAAGLNRQQIAHMLDEMHLTPKLIRTLIEANTGPAVAALKGLRSQLEGLDGRVFSATVKITREGSATVSTGGRTLFGQAEGGTIPGQRNPYGDKVLFVGAPGEEVITNRHGEADQFRADRAAGRIPHYAEGGTLGTIVPSHSGSGSHSHDSSSSSSSSQSTADATATHHLSLAMQHELRDMRRELAASKKALSDERQARQSLVQKEHQLVQSVQGALRTDVFSAQMGGGVWTVNGGFDPYGTLQSDLDNARLFDHALHKLDKRGLNAAPLAELAASGNVVGAQMLAHDSRSQLRRLDRLYRERQQLTHRVGEYAGQVRYGEAEREVTAHIQRLENRVRESNRHLKAIQHAAAHTGPKNTAKNLNTAAAKGARSRRRTP